MRLILLIFLSFAFSITFSQEYEPSWESLDKREVPEWFSDAKFGIFIHWGLYSVPAYRPFEMTSGGYPKKEGTYAEWYVPDVMYSPQKNDSWHEKTYGENFSYFDFLPMFRAELFDPSGWAELFKESGARYVVLTAKHSEGFAMWPSKEPHSKGWNAGEVGPRRDLAGELAQAVRKEGLRMGFYYSFLEYWTTQTEVWPANQNIRTGYYVPEEMWEKYHIPRDEYTDRLHFQVKELINTYEPDVLWTDAEWDYTEDEIRSPELLAWIYNNAPNKENIVVNDRWAKGTRGEHGGFYTTEYGEGSENIKPGHPWEECQGIGYSFGYNRAEKLEDYKSTEELLELLVTTVANGGNLLLNVGPKADGTIPLIMQMRLREMGRWMKNNGEAIYGTDPWSPVLPLKTVNPKAGDDILFTTKGEDLYVFLMNWNVDAVSLKEIGVHKDAAAYHLGSGKEVDIKVKRGGAIIEELPSDRKEPITVVRIEGAWATED
jgi:alpha-L-fucosidase